MHAVIQLSFANSTLRFQPSGGNHAYTGSGDVPLYASPKQQHQTALTAKLGHIQLFAKELYFEQVSTYLDLCQLINLSQKKAIKLNAG
jgi:hypothetical protein